jgi:malate synthase
VAERGGGVQIRAPFEGKYADIVAPEAMEFVAGLHRRFNPRRNELLAARADRQTRLDRGERPDFLSETKQIRENEWTVTRQPSDLLDRRVEITGSIDRQTIVNALNSGAKAFVADFEHSTAPTWENLVEGQINLRDAIRRTIVFEDEDTGKPHKLNEETAVLFVCPRGWHMDERHVLINGEPISASIFDFGIYFFHNAKELLRRGTGAYFYLSRMESHLEARLWNDIFLTAQQQLGVPAGFIKATVLVDSILAAFEMDEILWELREHSAGLTCGRWDYLFSFIKKFSGDESLVLPDRAQVTMTTHFMRSYSKLCVKTCHRRRVSAIGAMSALIPIENDSVAKDRTLSDLQADKEREVRDGHDGTWVAHPRLVPVAGKVFSRFMSRANQIDMQFPDFNPAAADLLQLPAGNVTEDGVRLNIVVGLGYIESSLRGIGRVPLFSQLEDAATAEISCAQLWQWVHHHANLDDGRQVTMEFVEETIKEELMGVKPTVGMERYRGYMRAAQSIREIVRAEGFTEFLALTTYPRIMEREHYPMT